ncbi:MAG: Npt1/Npt2 family nucleotide transporter, partial [Candidatus Riflebacteria bacterium]|nr:Npt1/Npt2 family nucleotide transporter [Candidatus Riflebacteria bacterium]
MALEMFFYTFSSTLFSQQFNHMVETELGGVNERTAFVAAIYGKINIVSLITQFFVTRLVMVFTNPIYGLLMLNIIQTAATLLMLKMPSLTIVSWTIIIRYALNYSTGRVLRELIYIPLDHDAKYQGKGFIDTVVFRFGDGLSSVVIFGGLQLFSYGKWIDFSILLAMAAQFYVIIKAANMYAERLHETGTDGVEPAPAGQ